MVHRKDAMSDISVARWPTPSAVPNVPLRVGLNLQKAGSAPHPTDETEPRGRQGPRALLLSAQAGRSQWTEAGPGSGPSSMNRPAHGASALNVA